MASVPGRHRACSLGPQSGDPSCLPKGQTPLGRTSALPGSVCDCGLVSQSPHLPTSASSLRRPWCKCTSSAGSHTHSVTHAFLIYLTPDTSPHAGPAHWARMAKLSQDHAPPAQGQDVGVGSASTSLTLREGLGSDEFVKVWLRNVRRTARCRVTPSGRMRVGKEGAELEPHPLLVGRQSHGTACPSPSGSTAGHGAERTEMLATHHLCARVSTAASLVPDKGGNTPGNTRRGAGTAW